VKRRRREGREPEGLLSDDPLWYKDAIIYQLHVRSFCDSNGDGIGDLRGLTGKLDYIRDLGVTAIWLLPFYPSPLKDDGYDIADYTGVNPSYGTLGDFKQLLREAHARGLRVITELVVNHTSDQHPWFQRARRSPPGSSNRDFYVWSGTPDRYKEARIIFKDFEHSNWSWDPVAGAYFWHRFYSHQPDLNYENPAVMRAIQKVMDFWFGMGVDGLRLDAVPYLFEREGTSCENLPETHGALRELRRHVDEKHRNRMLLAEANQWPEDAVAYFGEGDECHMAFHFPLMPRMFMALRMEDRYPIIDILDQTPRIPEGAQWAIFLRNHDELTLEMVTDEERDYMYRVYAADPQARINLGIRRRLAALLENDRRRIELMMGLLCSLPGTPVLYYGDEIGMGDNIYLGDRNGVRTPMQWNADRNAGFSEANPQRLFLPPIIDPSFSYESINVETEQGNPNSLLWWVKRLVALRRRFKAFGRGEIEFLYPSNRRVLAFLRRCESEQVLVVANLSRHCEFVELDLGEFRDMVPVEVFGHNDFPPIGELPYLLTLGPYSFYWFALKTRSAAEIDDAAPQVEPPRLSVRGSWEAVLRGRARTALNESLPGYLLARRWFGGKARRVKSAEIVDALTIPLERDSARIAVVRVDYAEGDPETYALPLAYAAGSAADSIRSWQPHEVVAELSVDGEPGVLFGALSDAEVGRALLEAIGRRRVLKGETGQLRGSPTRAFRAACGGPDAALDPHPIRTEQSNTSVVFGDRVIMKLFRKLDEGVNPELEIGSFLAERTGFQSSAAMAGSLDYNGGSRGPVTLAVLQAMVPNEGSAWEYALDAVGRYFDLVISQGLASEPTPATTSDLVALGESELPEQAAELIGPFLEAARLLGTRTAELHRALGSRDDEPAFAPEPFTPFYQRGLYQSMRNLTIGSFQLLRRAVRELPAEAREDAESVLGRQNDILARFRTILARRITALRTRIHGDYHLGQVLWTGRDFVIIDFEGEPALPISARRIKRSPLRDVAGMVRSFHYAAHHGLQDLLARGGVSAELAGAFGAWAQYWYAWAAGGFLRAYLRTAADSGCLPGSREEVRDLLEVYVLEKAVYELGYELNNRPQWVGLPLRGIAQLLSESDG